MLPAPLRPAAALPALAVLLPGALLAATPAPDMTPFPRPAASERRWVIQPPAPEGAAPRGGGGGLVEGRMVEVMVGRMAEVDCNLHRLGGSLRLEKVPGWGYDVVRVEKVGPMVSTLRACPPGEPRRRQFVAIGGPPFLVTYSTRLPLVVYAPKDLEVRWRQWSAEPTPRNALPL